MFKITCPVCRKVHTVKMGEVCKCECGAVWKYSQEPQATGQIAGWHKPTADNQSSPDAEG